MTKPKAWEDLTIADDYMFKLVMREKPLAKHFLERLLGIKIAKLMEPETEKAMKSGYDSKGIRLDVYVEDAAHTVYDIEMQMSQLGDATLGRRTRYYQSTIDFGALQAGLPYKLLKNSFIIFICPFKLYDGKRHVYTFQSICQEDKNICLNDGATKIMLSTKGELDDADDDIMAFLKFVDGLPVSNNFTDTLDKTIQNLKTIEKEKVTYMMYSLKMQDAREEGLEEGRNLGIRALISAAKKFAVTKAQAVEQVMEQYGLPESEAKRLVQESW